MSEPHTPRSAPRARAELERGLAALGLHARHAEPLFAYLALLERWNQTYNLTAVRALDDMVGRHVLDSLAMHRHLDDVGTLADLGTGAGLPGIPLAIVQPGLQVALVESAGKKARFLREAVRTLGLPNATVLESRAEAVAKSGQFDAITARALATLPGIVAVGGHLLRPGGRLLAMKGTRPDDEIAALPAGWRVEAIHPLQVPGSDAERHLVVVTRDS
ncbi:MAG TPA: 16S rRNA (guanine(527)-N(7))-methyltransferase RsmG [Luteimonas sp.]|nr:16S rRNA (guanine(527)-N(7))-methyltransferase RsmG [Luteimonas sp.]